MKTGHDPKVPALSQQAGGHDQGLLAGGVEGHECPAEAGYLRCPANLSEVFERPEGARP